MRGGNDRRVVERAALRDAARPRLRAGISALAFGSRRRAPGAGAWRLALGAALALCLSALTAAGAGAVIVRLASGRTLSYKPLRGAERTAAFGPAAPFDQAFSNVEYNGGPVMATNTNYAFYWDPSGGAAFPSDYAAGVNQYLSDLAHDSGSQQNVDSVAAQYNDAEGDFAAYESHFGGAILDTDPYPANGCTRAATCLTDRQIHLEIAKYTAANGLPRDLADEYFLLTPPGVESCFEASGSECSAGSTMPFYCAYHGSAPVAGGELVYADDPYVTGNASCDDGNHPNGSTADGAIEGGLSHEHDESITDPEPDSAWIQLGGFGGGEIADKCSESLGSPLGAAPNGASYNQVINGHLYWYQEEWSNQGHQCLQRLTFGGAEPTAAFTSEPGSGDEVIFDASASTAAGGVASYDWQFNDAEGAPSAPVETTTPTVSHTFPAAGAYTVALTVYAADGTSAGTASGVAAGEAPTVTKVTPADGPAAGGTRVRISGANFSRASAVSFGSVAAASFKVVSASEVTAVSPPGTGGSAVHVTVTTPSGTSAKSAQDRFRYGPPTVVALAPSVGRIAGGTSVVVSGSGFARGASATDFSFGAAAASSVSCSAHDECTVLAPKHAAGVVEVHATVNEETSATNPPGDRFTYR